MNTEHVVRKMIGAAGAVTLALILAILWTDSSEASPAEPHSIPACAVEDGSTQDICFWDASEHGNGEGHDVINIDHGSAAYYPETGILVTDM